MMLLQAAADEWKVPVGELKVANGVITHAATQRSVLWQIPRGGRQDRDADPRASSSDPKD
jgi:isoquinoline 1-oxidoreductase beta subunit